MAARASGAVEIHRIAPNDRPFVEVGVLDETGCWGDGTEKGGPAEIGCDALVIQGDAQTGGRYRAICIVYKN